MIKLISLFLLCSLFLFESCKKTEEQTKLPTHYKGVLVDLATRKPIANNKVYLITWASERIDVIKLWDISYADTSLILSNTPKGTVDSAITSFDGTFSFAYPPQVAPKDFLNIYWPTLGNHDLNYSYVKLLLAKDPYNYLDTFFTDPPCVLKIKMQKNTTVALDDFTFQTIDFYRANGIAINKQYFMGQKGKTNHTIEIPYSKNLADKANIEFRYYNNGLKHRYMTTLNLQPSDSTNLIIPY